MNVDQFDNSIFEGDEHWELENVVFDESKMEALIHVNYGCDDNKCYHCQSDLEEIDSNVQNWRHLDLSSYKSVITAKFPTLKCSDCDEIHKIDFPWAGSETKYSLGFKNYAKVMLGGSSEKRRSILGLSKSDADAILEKPCPVKAKLNRYDYYYIGAACLALVGLIVYIFISEKDREPPILGEDLVLNEGAGYFRHIDQGADQLALFVLLNLEGAHSGKPLIDDMKLYGFLDGRVSKYNKYGLPIGFTHTLVGNKDVSTMSCAACHTGRMRVDGKLYNVDGAGNLVYPMEWAKYINDSVQATLVDKSKLILFLMRAIKNENLPAYFNPEDVTVDYLKKLDEDIKQTKYVTKDIPTSGVDLSIEELNEIAEHIRQYARSKAIEESLDATMKGKVFDTEDFNKAYLSELKKQALDADETYETGSKRLENLLTPEEGDDNGWIDWNKTALCDNESIVDPNERALEANSSLLKLYRLLQEQTFFSKQILKIIEKLDEFDNTKNGGGFGPGRDDAWNILSRLVAETGESYLGEPAPVKIPNLYSYSLYYRSKLKAIEDERLTASASYTNEYYFHIDGNTNTMMQRNMLQALAIGALVGVDDQTLRSDTLVRGSLLTRVDLDKVHEAEMFYSRIKIPTFSELFPQHYSETLAEQGKELYNKEFKYLYQDADGNQKEHNSSCATCHENKAGKRVDIYKVGTDKKRWAFYNDTNFDDRVAAFKSLSGKAGALQRATELHETNVGRFIYRDGYNPKPIIWKRSEGYMARPLNGVWASPPYLHNGSVRTIYQLLLPASEREPEFYVGSRDYDTKNLGYFSRGEDTEIKNQDVRRYVYDRNTKEAKLVTYTFEAKGVNHGHEFGVDFTEPEKRALIEYLKSLGEPDELSSSK